MEQDAQTADVGLSPRSIALQTAVRELSTGLGQGDHGSFLSARRVGGLIASLSSGPGVPTPDEGDLEWMVAAKATVQVYGLVVSGLLTSAEKLGEEIWYWDGVTGTRSALALHYVQVAPLGLWRWGNAVWADVATRAGEERAISVSEAQETAGKRWGEFYGLVRKVVRERSVREVQRTMLGPGRRLRAEVRDKQKCLEKLRARNANAIGVLLGEGLSNESVHGDGLASPVVDDETRHRWKASVARNVALMEAVLATVNDLGTPVDKFDEAIAELTDDDPLYACEVLDCATEDEAAVSVPVHAVAERLSRVLSMALPQYDGATQNFLKTHGRPSPMVRYWLPITVGILSSSTVLKVFVHRQAEILQWMEEFGATVVDFWQNWVVEPTRKVIGTIRHDQASEVSIMSQRSLQGDRESLERMVVDFAVDNPANVTGGGAKLTDAQISDIRAKVHEGDLTPVLKVYEKELASPFLSTVRGNLIRALLIQIQKTKVDVEIAMGGIDNLLKSQELVFGFVGLTPGILVTYFVFSWARASLSAKRGSRTARKQGTMLRKLRNIDRVLVGSEPTEFGELRYRDQGLLLCEVHALRLAAGRVMPKHVYREFCVEADGLCDVRMGLDKQRRVLERVRWAYGRWLQ